MSTQTGFLFHFNDFINLYSYVLTNNNQLKIDQNSLNLVEICAPHQKCQWDQTLSCKHGRAYTYASLVKSQAGFELVRRIKYVILQFFR